MPYAAKDRQEFIKRSNIKPNSRVLDIGGLLSEEVQSEVSGITARRPAASASANVVANAVANAVLMKPSHLPFKDCVFDTVVSYHYLDLVPSDELGSVFKEVVRILDRGSVFSFMINLWIPQNEAQRSTLFFNEILRSAGVLYSHQFDDISGQLYACGFCEIIIETVKREIFLPRDFTRSHILMLGNLIKKEKEEGGQMIKTLARQYLEQVSADGESMLPALHFMAKKSS